MKKKTIIGEDGKEYEMKLKKPFYKKWWFWVLIVVLGVGIFGQEGASKNTADKTPETNVIRTDSNATKTTEVVKTPEVKEEVKKEDNVPTEYKSALSQAKTYSDMMHMSKAGIYQQLTSEYGGKFTTEAAQYAIDNVNADWNNNALKSAETYSDTMHMSKAGIYNQLTSEHGEQFTAEESQYAVDNVKADWNKNALESAKTYQDMMSMSPAAIFDQLTSEYGEQFTKEEAQYAIDNLE